MDFSTSSLANPGSPSPALAQPSLRGGQMEIVLTTGHRIIVGADVDTDALARVVRILTIK
jgi:hypothetical protein